MAGTYIDRSPTYNSAANIILSAKLFKQAIGDSFFIGKFAGREFIRTGDTSLISTTPTTPIQQLRDLEKTAGDAIYYDLIPDIRGDGVYGDEQLRGREKSLTITTDGLHIDQVRQGVDAGGRMTRKRTKHDLRAQARVALTRWFARFFDEAITCYLAGIRGEGTENWVLPTDWSGFAGNPLVEHDAQHTFTIDSTGNPSNNVSDATEFTLGWLDKLATYIKMMDPPPNPLFEGGEPYYVVVLHPKAVEQLRTDAGPQSWLEIQKAAGVRGTNNPIFTGALGRYGMFVLHEYSKIPYKTIGSDKYAYNLVLGAQAAVIAFGNASGKFYMDWYEELEDRGNRLVVTASTICGIKRCEFDGKAFGSLVMPSKF